MEAVMEDKNNQNRAEKIIGILIIISISFILAGLTAGYLIVNYMIPDTRDQHSYMTNN